MFLQMRFSMAFMLQGIRPALLAGGEGFVSASIKTTAKTTTKTV
jgi:hypothetical protein